MDHIPTEEQETVLVYEYETDTWSLYTCVRKHITRLMKVFSEEQFDKISRNEDGRIIAVQIDGVPEAHVLMRDVPKGRKMTEEQRLAQRERLRKARAAKTSQKTSDVE